MSTELERRLREALHADAERARLVNRNGPPAPEARPLADDQHPQRPARKLVAAAAVVAALALIGSALALRDDDQSVDTTQSPVVPAPRTIVSGPGCPFGITGDPVEVQQGPELLVDDLGGADPGSARFDTASGQGVAHTLVGTQVVEIRVPGFELTSPEGWRMEDIELERGPAALWLDGPASGVGNKPFVQVRYFPSTDEPCSSFTVTVDGGSEAANRETAIDFAERVVLPGEHNALDLPAPTTLAKGEDVEFLGNERLAAQTLSINVEEKDGEVTGEFSFSDIVFVRAECADTDTDGVVIIGGTVTEGDPAHLGDVGDLLAVTIREGDPDRVSVGPNDPNAGSCTELLESFPHDDFNESDFVAVEAGSDIETS